MMKKIYKHPTAKVVEIHSSNILADSLVVGGPGEKDQHGQSLRDIDYENGYEEMYIDE